MSSSSFAPTAVAAMPVTLSQVLAAYGRPISFDEWTPMAENRHELLKTFWFACLEGGEHPLGFHEKRDCFCGCSSNLQLFKSMASKPLANVQDFYNYIIEAGLVTKDDYLFQIAVANSIQEFDNWTRTPETPCTDFFEWALCELLLPETIATHQWIAECDRYSDEGDEIPHPRRRTLFHTIFNTLRPHSDVYSGRMLIYFVRAGFDFSTPSCISLMSLAITTSNTFMIRALHAFGVEINNEACAQSLFSRIRSHVGALRAHAEAVPPSFVDRSQRNEYHLWAAVARIIYFSAPLVRALADDSEDDDTRKLRLTGLLTAVHPRYFKYTSVDRYFAERFMKENINRLLVPTDGEKEDFATLLEALRVCEYDFSAKYEWTPFYGEKGPSTPRTPLGFYSFYSRVVEVLDEEYDDQMVELLRP